MDVEGSGKENESTRAFPFDFEESCKAVEEKGLEEVPVMLEDSSTYQEEQEEGSWEESCLLLFSNFLGFLMDRYEDDIFNMMKSNCERRKMVKGKGVQGTTKFDRDLKKYTMECEGERKKQKREHEP